MKGRELREDPNAEPIQPPGIELHSIDWVPSSERHDEGRPRLQYPFEGIRLAGAQLCVGSDWAVTTANPLEQLEVAVTRIDPENRDNAPFLPGQRLSLGHAVDAFTAGSVYVNHDDDGASRIGARADLAVLDIDVFAEDTATVAGDRWRGHGKSDRRLWPRRSTAARGGRGAGRRRPRRRNRPI
jgi:predicted amidohydrolase YtcJ